MNEPTQEPTEEEQRELLEWCGYTGKLESIEDIGEREGKLVYVSPPIDSNNLLRYAVPKLIEVLKYYCQVNSLLADWVFSIVWHDEDPALSLFWIVWQVKEASNG